jgi:hypothetical protein
VSFLKQLADRIGDGGLSQSSQSGEPIYWRGFRRVLLVDPSNDLRNDVDTCTLGARTTGKVVEVDGSTESGIARTR